MPEGGGGRAGGRGGEEEGEGKGRGEGEGEDRHGTAGRKRDKQAEMRVPPRKQTGRGHAREGRKRGAEGGKRGGRFS